MKRCVLYVDGASRGNPGAAAIGVSLQDATGKEIAGAGTAIGRATNNEAEYRALIEGLRLAHEQKCSELDVRSDSELVVRQMSGKYRVRHQNLKPLMEEATRKLLLFNKISISHIPREENSRADELANEALDNLGQK